MNETKTSRFVGFDRLKQSIGIGQVLERYGLLGGLRRSGETLHGACPLHQGHNVAQFRVNLTKNCWICFGDCHGGGTIIDFVSRKERIGIRQAGLLLQDWFAVASESTAEHTPPRETALYPSPSGTLHPPKLVNAPLGFTLGVLGGGHGYLRQRGLTPQTIATFGLGLCPHGSLRGWIAIPIHNAQGRLVAYAGRWPGLLHTAQPKYRLPRGFRKSLELFNQHRAVAYRDQGPLVVTEGYFGCMHVWQAGYRRVVSIMGSMLSASQEGRILELAGAGGKVLLLFDEDAAGRKGRSEAAERLSKSLAVRIVRLEEGQQPDSLSATQLRPLLEAVP